ncbi:MAG TPA: POTRA domain-containing protein, partial [Terracidiphilus sp.]|nr:POTRA domain-containing protein [Terracidiphilus sp.]
MRAWKAGDPGTRRKLRILLAGVFLLACAASPRLWCQAPDAGQSPDTADVDEAAPASSLEGFAGLVVRRIDFEGVNADRVQALRGRLAVKAGEPLTSTVLTRSLRTVYGSGLFETVDAQAQREGDGVALTFAGTARTFVGVVSVYGARGATINTQLQRASRLQAGTRFTPPMIDQAVERMKQVLADNGYHEPVIAHTLTPHPQDQLVDIAFQVTSGPQARVGDVQVSGDPGMSAAAFRRYARLHAGA